MSCRAQQAWPQPDSTVLLSAQGGGSLQGIAAANLWVCLSPGCGTDNALQDQIGFFWQDPAPCVQLQQLTLVWLGCWPGLGQSRLVLPLRLVAGRIPVQLAGVCLVVRVAIALVFCRHPIACMQPSEELVLSMYREQMVHRVVKMKSKCMRSYRGVTQGDKVLSQGLRWCSGSAAALCISCNGTDRGQKVLAQARFCRRQAWSSTLIWTPMLDTSPEPRNEL